MVEKVEAAGAGIEGSNSRRRPMEVPADLESRFLRVGNKLYRSAHDKEPIATITPIASRQRVRSHCLTL